MVQEDGSLHFEMAQPKLGTRKTACLFQGPLGLLDPKHIREFC